MDSPKPLKEVVRDEFGHIYCVKPEVSYLVPVKDLRFKNDLGWIQIRMEKVSLIPLLTPGPGFPFVSVKTRFKAKGQYNAVWI